MKKQTLKDMKNSSLVKDLHDELCKVLDGGFLTRGGLDKLLGNQLFRIWGIEYQDVSDINFSKLDKTDFNDIPFGSTTKFPKKSMLPADFEPNKILQKSYKRASNFDDSKVCMALIDNPTQLFEHREFENLNYELVDYSQEDKTHFHMECVLANIASRSFGYAKDAKFVLYCRHYKDKEVGYLKALQDVLSRIKKGQKIQVVSISNLLFMPEIKGTELEKDLERVIKDLNEHDCQVIDSMKFAQSGFSPLRLPLLSKESDENYVYSVYNPNKFGLGVKTSNVLPEFATKNGYVADCMAGVSYAIPTVSYFYALFKTRHPRATFEKYISLCQKYAKPNNSGVKIVDFERVVC